MSIEDEDTIPTARPMTWNGDEWRPYEPDAPPRHLHLVDVWTSPPPRSFWQKLKDAWQAARFAWTWGPG